MRRYPVGVLAAATIAIAQIIALYVLLPGITDPSGTAMQSDSYQYYCYGLSLVYTDSESVIAASGPLLSFLNQAPETCVVLALDNPLVWQVYPRLLLSSLIGLSALAFGPFGALVPSILTYLLIAGVWLFVVYQHPPLRSRLGSQALYAGAGIIPLASFSMMIWPASVLTEGPTTLLLMFVAVILARPVRFRLEVLWLSLIGVALMVTRQLWPLVATIWAVVGARAANAVVSVHHWRIMLVAFMSFLAALLAVVLHTLLEHFTVPAGLPERQGHLPAADLTTLSGLWDFSSSALSSTGSDILRAAERFDFLSPLTLTAAIVSLLWLFKQRQWGLAFIGVCAWALGAYAVGLFAREASDYNSHFRFLVPAVMYSLSAAWTVWCSHASYEHKDQAQRE